MVVCSSIFNRCTIFSPFIAFCIFMPLHLLNYDVLVLDYLFNNVVVLCLVVVLISVLSIVLNYLLCLKLFFISMLSHLSLYYIFTVVVPLVLSGTSLPT